MSLELDRKLWRASLDGKTALVKKYLQDGANPKYSNADYHFTPLILASREGFYNIVKILAPISDINAQEHTGKTALHLAVEKGTDSDQHYKIVKELIDNDADLTIKDDLQELPIDKTNDRYLINSLLLHKSPITLKSIVLNPKTALPLIHKKMNMENMWYSLFFYLKDYDRRDMHTDSSFYFNQLINLKEMPADVKILLNVLFQ